MRGKMNKINKKAILIANDKKFLEWKMSQYFVNTVCIWKNSSKKSVMNAFIPNWKYSQVKRVKQNIETY